MKLNPLDFMGLMEKRINFSHEDKALLHQHTDWGWAIAPIMADYFYKYLGRDIEMSAILNAQEGRMHRLRETFVQWFHEPQCGKK